MKSLNETYDSMVSTTSKIFENIEKNNAAEYIEKVFDVVGSATKDAEHPPFDESKINESKFPKNLRFKNWGIEVDDNTLQIDWETYSDFTIDDIEPFLVELKRFINYHLEKIDNPKLLVDLSMHSRYADADSYTENGENFYFDLIEFN